MRRKALVLSLLIHAILVVAALLPFTVPSGTVNQESRRSRKLSNLAPPPARKARTEEPMTNGTSDKEPLAPVDIAAIANSMTVVIDKQGFDNIFQAAQHWGATLRHGVPYSDPHTYDIYFCRPESYPGLDGKYVSGDLVWFSFPTAFQQRILERLGEYLRENPQKEPPPGIRLRFTSAGPNFFEILLTHPSVERSSACS